MWPVPEVIDTPSHALLAMTFPSPAPSPPILAPFEPAMSTPWCRLPRGPLLAALRPIKLPWTTFPVPPLEKPMPDQPLPEMTLPAPAAPPPIVVFDAPSTQIPSSVLAIASVPVALVPM